MANEKIMYDPSQGEHVNLKVINKYSYSASLPNSKCLKWSPSNRLIGLNLSSKLILYEINLNFAINTSITNRRIWKDENLKFTCTEIVVPYLYSYNIGDHVLHDDDDNIDLDLIVQPKQSPLQILDFEFAHSTIDKSIELVGVLSTDYCLFIYLHLNFKEWSLIRNVSRELNQHYIENIWPKETIALDLDGYYARLESISISAFCWNPCETVDDECVRYEIYCGTKSGDVCLFDLKINECDEFIQNKLQFKKIFPKNLSEIHLIRFYNRLLLTQSYNGKIDLQFVDLKDKTLMLWNDEDYLPSYNFVIRNSTKIKESHVEIIFNKIDSIIYCSVDCTNGQISFCRTILLRKHKEILTLYGDGCHDSNRLYLITIDLPKVYNLVLDETCNENTRLELFDVNIDNLNLSKDLMYFDFQITSNNGMIALVTSHKTFCTKSHFAAKNVTVYFCSNKSPTEVCQYLKYQLKLKHFKPNQLFLTNLIDFLYLFRNYLFSETVSMKVSFEEIFESCCRLIDLYEQLDWSVDKQNCKNNLIKVKLIYFLLKRYWELSLFEEIQFYNEDAKERLSDLVIKSLPELIRRQTLQMILDRYCTSTHINNELYKPEQVQSLFNLSQLSQIKQCPVEFNTDQQGNSCPYCEHTIDVTTGVLHCPNHQLDICTNSFTIIDPFKQETEICISCLESKLARPRVWPVMDTFPFAYLYNQCYYCL